jgi:hypothetical protein
MEVKNLVILSVKTTIRTFFELFIIAFAILLPLTITAYATMATNLSFWAIFTCGVIGTLIWWRFCWFAFWIMI